MKAILSIDKNWGIGYKGELLKRVPEDMRFFKQTTLGKVVVMGRTTFESLPGREPLKDRINIVLSRNIGFSHPGVTVCRSIDELLQTLKSYRDDEVYVIGGGDVYRQLLPYCSEVLVTKFDAGFTADTYFPNLDREEGWVAEVISDSLEYDGMKYSRIRYTRK